MAKGPINQHKAMAMAKAPPTKAPAPPVKMKGGSKAGRKC